jgi:hypothetical protein
MEYKERDGRITWRWISGWCYEDIRWVEPVQDCVQW